jgi:hypothetical protein
MHQQNVSGRDHAPETRPNSFTSLPNSSSHGQYPSKSKPLDQTRILQIKDRQISEQQIFINRLTGENQILTTKINDLTKANQSMRQQLDKRSMLQGLASVHDKDVQTLKLQLETVSRHANLLEEQLRALGHVPVQPSSGVLTTPKAAEQLQSVKNSNNEQESKELDSPVPSTPKSVTRSSSPCHGEMSTHGSDRPAAVPEPPALSIPHGQEGFAINTKLVEGGFLNKEQEERLASLGVSGSPKPVKASSPNQARDRSRSPSSQKQHHHQKQFYRQRGYKAQSYQGSGTRPSHPKAKDSAVQLKGQDPAQQSRMTQKGWAALTIKDKENGEAGTQQGESTDGRHKPLKKHKKKEARKKAAQNQYQPKNDLDLFPTYK